MLVAAALGLLIGAAIGGLGGGGGVLTVPVLVYVIGQGAQDATTGSVVIVGITAAVGAVARIRSGTVQWPTGLAFGAVGIPSAALGTVVGRHSPQPVLLLAFAALTVVAATALLLNSRDRPAPAEPPGSGPGPSGTRSAVALDVQPPRQRVGTAATVVTCGLAIGFLTGFLGVGGGFLIVPALVIALRMPMTHAIGTSLLIIAVNSAAAFATRVGVAELDWTVLVPFTLAAVAGSVAGKRIADRLSGTTLSRAFAIMLLAVGAYVAVRSLTAL